jgi:hypothetical protein
VVGYRATIRSLFDTFGGTGENIWLYGKAYKIQYNVM